ncbi:helix-turn-helix domain-containing protein [Cryptosporangium sp. NPDC051539]|uniref:helix-turn-helix domain-containing protein n=1 Tax=Cryptosporangium sp. NPDC051539 TaxID=3363962 RepID=UPI0037A98A35
MESSGDEPVTTAAATPTVVRRQLGRRLRLLRDTAGVSVETVVSDPRLGISRAKLYKLEAGKHPAKPQDVAALCRHYRASNEELEALTTLALATQGTNWWHIFGADAVPEWFSLYVDLEPAAAWIRSYQPELVPGLLQTPEYAVEVYRARNPEDDGAELQRRVGVRMERQAILKRPRPPVLHFVLNEAVILREVGGSDVMGAQTEKLREMAGRPSVTIDVLPLKAGAHAAMEGAFVILDFEDPQEDPSVVYLDSPSSAVYLQQPTELERYTTIFDHVRAATVPLQEYLT